MLLHRSRRFSQGLEVFSLGDPEQDQYVGLLDQSLVRDYSSAYDSLDDRSETARHSKVNDHGRQMGHHIQPHLVPRGWRRLGKQALLLDHDHVVRLDP